MNYKDALEILESLDITEKSYKLGKNFILGNVTHERDYFFFSKQVETKFVFSTTFFDDIELSLEHNPFKYVILYTEWDLYGFTF